MSSISNRQTKAFLFLAFILFVLGVYFFGESSKKTESFSQRTEISGTLSKTKNQEKKVQTQKSDQNLMLSSHQHEDDFSSEMKTESRVVSVEVPSLSEEALPSWVYHQAEKQWQGNLNFQKEIQPTPSHHQRVSNDLVGAQEYFQFPAHWKGIPIQSAGIHAMIKTGKDGVSRLVFLENRKVDLPPQGYQINLSKEQAIGLARKTLNLPNTPVQHTRSVIRLVSGQPRPVFEVGFKDQPKGALVDQESRRVWVKDFSYSQENAELEVVGNIVPFDPIVNKEAFEARSLDGLEVKAYEHEQLVQKSYTNSDGKVELKIKERAQVSTTLDGKYFKILTDTNDSVPVFNLDLSPGEAFKLISNQEQSEGISEFELAKTNAYYHLTQVRDYLVKQGIELNDKIKTKVNLEFRQCNAMYMWGGLYFFKATSRCPNSAYDTVVYHEFGHYVDDLYGGIQSGALSEGWGDVIAILMTKQPLVGESFRDYKGPIRTANNKTQYEKNPRREVHKAGEVWMGFVWHFREALIEVGEPDALVEALVLPSLVSNAKSIKAALMELILRDDDDGLLTNGTPHIEQIKKAMEIHGLRDLFNDVQIQWGSELRSGDSLLGLN
ncbi:MAG: hypothetical protein CL678_05215 [Bdellovibrionaceae bacterium]|nr:hypothetical protein [Pseudobdellovibrionaceae bacterium]|tara:strand:- start:5497 stop:7317 length:1821 start_codon:yes stop_codon:yes gene_type:complete